MGGRLPGVPARRPAPPRARPGHPRAGSGPVRGQPAWRVRRGGRVGFDQCRRRRSGPASASTRECRCASSPFRRSSPSATTANLTDPVWDNADAAPDAVQFVRPAARRPRPGRRHLPRSSATRSWRSPAAWSRRVSQPGDRVALMSRTRYEWTLLDYAIWAAGAVTVPIYETSSAEQVAWILADSGAVACVVETDAHATPVAGVRDRLPDCATSGRSSRAAAGRARRRTARRSTRPRSSAAAPRSRRRRRHDHLHQRHHRPAQGLRADPPQHVRRHRQRHARAAEPVPAGAPRRCCSCRWRTPSPG